MSNTRIEWCDRVWNPISGCSHSGSPGCDHCYARRMAQRLKGRFGYPADDPFRVTLHRDRLEEPWRWRKRSRVFICSMGDLFHEDVPHRFIQDVINALYLGPKDLWNETPHTYIVLTKRPERMRDFFGDWTPEDWNDWPHLWLGVTAENQQRADERIPILLQIPAKVKFVSIEPMLGSVDLDGYLEPQCCTVADPGGEPGLDWVIAGGETGPGARPMNPDWVRSLRDQCQNAGVSFFFKKWNDSKEQRNILAEDNAVTWWENHGRLLDGRLWEEYPD